MKKQIGILIFTLAIAIGLSGAVEAQTHKTPSVACPSEEGPSHVGQFKLPRGVQIGPQESEPPSHWGPKLPKQIPGYKLHRHGMLIHDGNLRIGSQELIIKHGKVIDVKKVKHGKVIH